MPKFMIHDKTTGDIIRAINLPYEGELTDISSMPDDEFDTFAKELHLHSVELDKDGQTVKDEKGLPSIKLKESAK